MCLIDANIFLEVLLDRKQAGQCKQFLQRVELGSVRGILTSFSLHAIEVVMIHFNKRKELEIFLGAILSYSGLVIYHTSIEEEIEIVALLEKERLDFDDALQLFVSKKFQVPLVSFDTDFDHSSIQRLEPKDVP